MGNQDSKLKRYDTSGDKVFEVSNPSQSPALTSQNTKVRALHNFSSENARDLPFEKGDILFVFSDPSDPWWYAEHSETHRFGYIPCNYVVVDDGSPTSLDSWFDIGRLEAEKKLILPGSNEGTYILRPSSRPQSFALSVRSFDPAKTFYVVRHYKIQLLDSGAYCIIENNQFPNIKSLISYYNQHCDGLCCRLSEPFPKGKRPPIQFREIEVNRNCLQMQGKIGSGHFGDVWLAKWNDKVEVAVKQLKNNYIDQNQRQCCLDEAKLMHQLHHPRIVEILGVCSEPIESPVYIITELMSNGALLDFLRKDKGKSVNFGDMILMMNHIADGMSYLESKNFIHRDLRAANILVGDDMSVKVADFGLARLIEDVYEASTESKFPIKWTSPEAGLRQIFSNKSDVWSFGVVMYEIVTFGRVPYANLRATSVLEAVDKGYRLKQPEDDNCHCPTELFNIMLACWEANPERRPTFIHLKDLFDNYVVGTERHYESH